MFFASPAVLAMNPKGFKKFHAGAEGCPQGQRPSISSRKQKAFRSQVLTPWSQATVGLDLLSVQSRVCRTDVWHPLFIGITWSLE